MSRENTIKNTVSCCETQNAPYRAVEIQDKEVRTIADVQDLDCVKKIGAAVCNLNKIKIDPRLLTVEIEEGCRYFALHTSIKKEKAPFLSLKDGVISYDEASVTDPWGNTDRLIVCNNTDI